MKYKPREIPPPPTPTLSVIVETLTSNRILKNSDTTCCGKFRSVIKNHETYFKYFFINTDTFTDRQIHTQTGSPVEDPPELKTLNFCWEIC